MNYRTGRRRLLRVAALSLALSSPTGAPAAGNIEVLPGAVEFAQPLRQRLAAELAARGSAYVPRTRNLRADGSPRFTNRLLLESSPYLEQHAHNPVNWFPWGDEAFAEAARLNRPVLVSIGYSTCHWCHVMEEESFDDPQLAEYLNAHFIAVKVDREARPDIDAVYMAAIYALGGRGGWPLNAFLTAERKPFYAGTYFPPQDRGSRLGFRSVLESIATQYAAEPNRIAEMSAQVAANIAKRLGDIAATATSVPDADVLTAAGEAYTSRIDGVWGGIGRGTKFPSTVPEQLLLRIERRKPDAETRRLVELTLEKMAAGGIRDHVGGGFHRYSTDSRWLVPHFEKMLYDNAQIAETYLEAAHATGRADYVRIARQTLDYLADEMTAPGGGFYSATDADSRNPEGEMEEGWFFTWTPAEITAVLGPDDARVVSSWFGVSNAGRLDGRSILHTWRSEAEVATELGIEVEALRATVAKSIPKLYAARSRRPPPLRDDKIIAAWNGLAISAFARAGFALAEPAYTRAAARAADFVLREMRRDGRLIRIHKDGRSDGPAFLEDYAFVIGGLLDLYEADFDPRWLLEAEALQAQLDRHYRDDLGGGYFKVADDQEQLLAREKPNTDGVIPSGNSRAARNLVRLAEITSDASYAETAIQIFSAFDDALTRAPTRLPDMLMALDMFLGGTKEVVLIRPASGTGQEDMLAALRASYTPNRVVSLVTEGAEQERLAETIPLVAGRRAVGGRTTAYVCVDKVCDFPTSDPEVFARQLLDETAAP